MTASQSGTGKVQDEPEQFCCTKKQNTLKKKKKLGMSKGQRKRTEQKQDIGANLKRLPLVKSDLSIKIDSKGLLPSK